MVLTCLPGPAGPAASAGSRAIPAPFAAEDVDAWRAALRSPAAATRAAARQRGGEFRDTLEARRAMVTLQGGPLPDGTEPSAAEAYQLIEFVGLCGDVRQLSGLCEFLRYPDPGTQVSALRALGTLGDRGALPPVRTLARHTPCGARTPFALLQALGLTLGKLGDPADAPLLRKWVRNCPRIRVVAMESLGLTSGIPAVEAEAQRLMSRGPSPREKSELKRLVGAVRETCLARDETRRASTPAQPPVKPGPE